MGQLIFNFHWLLAICWTVVFIFLALQFKKFRGQKSLFCVASVLIMLIVLSHILNNIYSGMVSNFFLFSFENIVEISVCTLTIIVILGFFIPQAGREKLRQHEEQTALKKQFYVISKLASIGELTASVAHEINNPLTIIKGHLSAVESFLKSFHDNKDSIEKSVSIMQSATVRVERIVKGLRTYAREDDSSEIVKFDCQAVIKESVSLIDYIYQRSGIKIDVQYIDDGTIIYGNPGKFQQVIFNLLSNAKDALESRSEKKISITISKKRKVLKVRISDNGCGMNEEVLSRIFEKFYTTKEKGRGTGLGMSIITNILSEMKGHIYVKSVTGDGTTFIITLHVEDVAPVKKVQKSYGRDQKLTGTVLIAEDEVAIRELLAMTLKDMGLKVQLAADGEEALQILKSQKVDILITDLQMPKRSGVELIEHMENWNERKIPVIVITGGIISGRTDRELELIQDKTSGMIMKPFEWDVIYSTIRKALIDDKTDKDTND